MDLELIEKPPTQHGRSSWTTFAVDDDRFELAWWVRPDYDPGRRTYREVLSHGSEVARATLDHNVSFDRYVGAPALGSQALEIELIEVASSHRRQGIGTALVHALMERYPDRRLVAFSEDVDDFWSSLGWDRYQHPDGWPRFRPLYIQPR